MEVLENSLLSYKNETQGLNNSNNSYTNGDDESFSSLINEEEAKKSLAAKNAKNDEKVAPVEPYVADVLKVIKNVRKEATDLEERVRYYKGSAGDRVFKQFNEKIIRLLISLDRVDVKRYALLKEQKKDAIEYLKEIQAVLKTR